jgi:hypothetical protein
MRVCGWGQTGWTEDKRGWTGEGTLLLSDKRFAHVRQKPWMRRATPKIVLACVAQTQGPVYGVTHVARVGVLLAVVSHQQTGHKARVSGVSIVLKPQHKQR